MKIIPPDATNTSTVFEALAIEKNNYYAKIDVALEAGFITREKKELLINNFVKLYSKVLVDQAEVLLRIKMFNSSFSNLVVHIQDQLLFHRE